ncbi:MAG: SAM-dependent chlorinase/fluorinase [Thermodesulfobacteriota bacterium]|nr:SAM-dependent chlorinase/fluorinase [Thermodesulfobacteriota bacterium]
MSIITLITDFGVDDEYVGVMKGVILSINPAAIIVDITHHIEPQDLIHAAYIIKYSFKYFPEGTVHIVVVDPGVGGDRAIIALEVTGHIFLAPDNGVLTLLMDEGNIGPIVRVDDLHYFLESVSQTFHGRDIFAPVAGHLSKGIKIKTLGTPIDKIDLKRLPIKYPGLSNSGELFGTVVSIDRFGNLITNIDAKSLDKFCKACNKEKLEFRIGQNKIIGLSKSYESALPQNPLAIIGSRGYLEIAVNYGSARRYFMADKGDTVTALK